MARPPVLTGTVTAFDDPAGLGEVRAADGTVLRFHCTAVADGSRTIDPGTEVAFTVVPGRTGGWEADALVPIP